MTLSSWLLTLFNLKTAECDFRSPPSVDIHRVSAAARQFKSVSDKINQRALDVLETQEFGGGAERLNQSMEDLRRIENSFLRRFRGQDVSETR